MAGIVLLALLLAACGGVRVSPRPTSAPAPSSVPGPSAPPPPVTRQACDGTGGVPGGNIPARFATALAFAPDGRLFWAERFGIVRVFHGGVVSTFADLSASTSTSGERGLLGLALSPSFATDHLVYAFHSTADGSHQEVVRWYDDCAPVGSGTGKGLQVVVAGLPAGSDCCHKGGRIAFGGDGKLYVTLGDEHTSRQQAAPPAQDPSRLVGKVLRYNPDGSIPADNPFGPANPAWARGLRNVFGIAFGPGGAAVVTDNGPSGDAGTPCGSCGDRVISLARGSAYQWPFCWGYSHVIAPYSGCGGQVEPEYSAEGGSMPRSNPFFVAPTGVAWAGSGAFAGHFVFCNQTPGHLEVLNGRHSVTDSGLPGCTLDVKQGPDGHLYYSDADTIHRF
ncbi:MAG: PQQ-dependent sugar dehydrogenase [Candidatus Dormibacteria bacterium]